ncbi:MAG: hypothetical protein WCE88_05535, partial [Burkholderiales bacterium]
MTSRRGAPFIRTRSEKAGTVQRVAALYIMMGVPMAAPAPRLCPPWLGHRPRQTYSEPYASVQP